jgi:phenylacetate-CoA ligase
VNRFAQYERIEFGAPDKISSMQGRLLREHVAYCATHSSYYRGALAEHGLKVGNLDSLDVTDLPITDKDQLSHHNKEFFAVEPSQVADIVFSSGTTGAPTQIIYTEGDLGRLAYNEKQSMIACGLSSDDIVLLTCTMDRCFIAGLAYFVGVRACGAAAIRNGHGTLESHGDVIRRVAPSVIIGVPSFLVKLASYLIKAGMDLQASSVKKLICIGEPLRAADMHALQMTQDLERLWGADAFSTYASSETVTTFGECVEKNGGHLHPELAILEILDEAGHAMPDGTIGEIVVTPLGIEGMPMIRYRTGDVGFLDSSPCACGRNSPRLGPILGRRKQMLKIQGTSLYPQAVHAVLDEIPEVREYFLEVFHAGQKLADRLVIHLSLVNGVEEVGETDEGAKAAVVRLLQARLRVTPEVVVHTHTEICQIVFTPHSRKPVRFVDRRI